MRPGSAAAFVDKDGTLVADVPYNVDPRRIVLAPGAREGVASLCDAGYSVVVVSNQPGAALGYFAETALAGVERKLRELLQGRLSAFYYCPHAPQGGCGCRKPAPGLLLRAAREHGFDLARSWMVGDILDDVEAGRRAGCRTCLVDNGNETEWKPGAGRRPNVIVADFAGAAAAILATTTCGVA
jgi:D-glycero-D-manno-heptose 1,7-bisphosphate phosphatase